MYQILIVEDSIDIQEVLTLVLEPIANLQKVSSVKSALDILENHNFDLILMDVMLDDGDGFNLVKQIRQRPQGNNVPVIFLTSKNDITDKITGFQLGAEDYIVKPFDPREIRLRIESRLKKINSVKTIETMVKGNLKLDIPLQKAYLMRDNLELGLTPLQFKILFYLMSHENKVISRDELISVIWGKDIHIGRSIDTHVNSLRRKLGENAKCIQAVYGAGYVFRPG